MTDNQPEWVLWDHLIKYWENTRVLLGELPGPAGRTPGYCWENTCIVGEHLPECIPGDIPAWAKFALLTSHCLVLAFGYLVSKMEPDLHAPHRVFRNVYECARLMRSHTLFVILGWSHSFTWASILSPLFLLLVSLDYAAERFCSDASSRGVARSQSTYLLAVEKCCILLFCFLNSALFRENKSMDCPLFIPESIWCLHVLVLN